MRSLAGQESCGGPRGREESGLRVARGWAAERGVRAEGAFGGRALTPAARAAGSKPRRECEQPDPAAPHPGTHGRERDAADTAGMTARPPSDFLTSPFGEFLLPTPFRAGPGGRLLVPACLRSQTGSEWPGDCPAPRPCPTPSSAPPAERSTWHEPTEHEPAACGGSPTQHSISQRSRAPERLAAAPADSSASVSTPAAEARAAKERAERLRDPKYTTYLAASVA